MSFSVSKRSRVFLNFLSYDTNPYVEDLAKNCVSLFEKKYKETLLSCSYSAVNLEFINLFFSAFEECIFNLLNEKKIEFFIDARKELYNYSKIYTEYVDLYDFINVFSKEIENVEDIEKLKLLYRNLILENCTLNSYKNCIYGLGLNFPQDKKNFSFYTSESNLEFLKIYQKTKWSEFLREYRNSVN